MFKSDRCGIEMKTSTHNPLYTNQFKSDRCGIEIEPVDVYIVTSKAGSNQTVAGLKFLLYKTNIRQFFQVQIRPLRD